MDNWPDEKWIVARIRSNAIREFCEKAEIAASVEALNIPDDVKIFRMAYAIDARRK